MQKPANAHRTHCHVRASLQEPKVSKMENITGIAITTMAYLIAHLPNKKRRREGP
jgi:hypothetical protein